MSVDAVREEPAAVVCPEKPKKFINRKVKIALAAAAQSAVSFAACLPKFITNPYTLGMINFMIIYAILSCVRPEPTILG